MPKDTIGRFSNRVENYVKYRPAYPFEMLEFFQTELGLTINSIVADIGSGPGISSKPFLENGNTVFGVEPNPAMRDAADVVMRDFPEFHNIDGTSENTTLADKSVDFIIAAQAFHWFDIDNTKIEFERILKDSGFVALIWNERQLDSNQFLRDYENVLLKFGTDYQEVRHERITNEVLEEAFRSKFDSATFENSQILDFEGMKGRILSSSYMPAEVDPQFADLEKNLKTLFAEHQKNGNIQVLYSTNIFYTKF